MILLVDGVKITDILLYSHIPIATPLYVAKQYAPPANAERRS